MRMSLTIGSLSSGSIGPSPVISSRISATKSSSSWALSARRSASVYCDTSTCTCRRTSSSGIFSRTERLSSSIKRRCRRTLASSSFSLSSVLTGATTSGGGSAAASAGAASGGSVTGGSGTAIGGPATARREVKRPSMGSPHFSWSMIFSENRYPLFGIMLLTCAASARGHRAQNRPRTFGAGPLAGAGAVRRDGRREHLLEHLGDALAGLHVVERHAAVDRLAPQPVIVWNGP